MLDILPIKQAAFSLPFTEFMILIWEDGCRATRLARLESITPSHAIVGFNAIQSPNQKELTCMNLSQIIQLIK